MREVQIEGREIMLRDHLKAVFQLTKVERKSQTGNLGKWFLITTNDRFLITKRGIYRQLGGIFSSGFKSEEKVTVFQMPGRTNGPTLDEKHENYLDHVAV